MYSSFFDLSKLLGTVKVLLKSESLLKSNILKQACSIKWYQASIWKPTKLKLKSANLIFQKGAFGPEKLILIYIRKIKDNPIKLFPGGLNTLTAALFHFIPKVLL